MVQRDRLDRLAGQALRDPPPARLTVRDITERAQARRRRAQLIRAGAGALAIVLVVTISLTFKGDKNDNITVAAVSQSDGGTIELSDSGIWPAGAGNQSPSSLARDFADQVLGWAAATITTNQALPGDPTWVTIYDPTSGTDLRVLAVPAEDADHWRLIQIGTGLLYRPGDTGVRVELGAPPPSATQVAVYASIDRATRYFRGPVNDTTTSIELTGTTDRSELHSVLILYQTANGQVINATGGLIDR